MIFSIVMPPHHELKNPIQAAFKTLPELGLFFFKGFA